MLSLEENNVPEERRTTSSAHIESDEKLPERIEVSRQAAQRYRTFQRAGLFMLLIGTVIIFLNRNNGLSPGMIVGMLVAIAGG